MTCMNECRRLSEGKYNHILEYIDTSYKSLQLSNLRKKDDVLEILHENMI